MTPLSWIPASPAYCGQIRNHRTLKSQRSCAGERSSGAVMTWAQIMHTLTASKKTSTVGKDDKSHRWRKWTARLSTLTMMDTENLEINQKNCVWTASRMLHSFFLFQILSVCLKYLLCLCVKQESASNSMVSVGNKWINGTWKWKIFLF